MLLNPLGSDTGRVLHTRTTAAGPDVVSGGYVECDNCGHPVENHDTKGCTYEFDGIPCGCAMRWTLKEIRAVRKLNGLPARWSRSEF